MDAEGKEITSCIVDKHLPGKAEELKRDRPPHLESSGKALNELEHLLLDGNGEEVKLHERIPSGAVVVNLDLWAEACRKKGLANSTTEKADSRRRAEDKAFERALEKLEKIGLGVRSRSACLDTENARPDAVQGTPGENARD